MDPEHPSTPSEGPDLTMLTQVESELADVAEALARLDDGTYGTCRVCGSAIRDERLGTAPATSLCDEHAGT